MPAPAHEGTIAAANGRWTLHALKGLSGLQRRRLLRDPRHRRRDQRQARNWILEAERGVRQHCRAAPLCSHLNQQKPSVFGSVLPELIEANVQRPPLPLSCVNERGAISMCQNDLGSASSAQTMAARITEA